MANYKGMKGSLYSNLAATNQEQQKSNQTNS
jgi:hypothetical protein